MRLLHTESTEQMIEEVNQAVTDGAGVVYTVMAAEMRAAEDTEHAEAHDTDLTVVITTAATEFAKVQAVNQVGALEPAVIAAGDGDAGPVLLIVDDERRVKHQPSLRKTLEDNAAALVEDLGLGHWLFRVEDGPTGTRLGLLNPRHLNGKPALLNGVDRNIVIAPQSQWVPRDHVDTARHYSRDADRPHIAIVEGAE